MNTQTASQHAQTAPQHAQTVPEHTLTALQHAQTAPRHVETGVVPGDLAEGLVLPDSIVDDGEPLDAVAEGVRAHPAVPEQGDGAEEQRPRLPAIRQGAYHSLAN